MPGSVFWPDARYLPHGDMATQVMLSVWPCKKDCLPVRWFLITNVLPRGKAMCVPSGCHFRPFGTLPAQVPRRCMHAAQFMLLGRRSKLRAPATSHATRHDSITKQYNYKQKKTHRQSQ